MAMTHDYLDQLDQNVGIAPANSQEEYQAAQTIADIMRRHGVEPSIEEFDAKAFGGVMDQILFAMLFVGMLLVGIGAVPLTVIGFVLVALPMAAFVARYLGNDFVEKLGPSARSQNVVAFHKGEGPLVQKGVRPIVIVAHYDTPHENPVYSTPLAPYLPMAWRFSKWCVLAVAVATLFQIMAFLPEVFRRILWVVGLIAALPLLLPLPALWSSSRSAPRAQTTTRPAWPPCWASLRTSAPPASRAPTPQTRTPPTGCPPSPPLTPSPPMTTPPP